jgi:DNA modification methylase
MYDNQGIRLFCGDALEVLKTLPDASVHCVVTSPPYYGLRDYQTATWEGGDPFCDHQPPDEAGRTTKHTAGQRSHAGRFSGGKCWKCGATRIDSQIGLEKTPAEFVAKLVEVFREVRRVLRDDGTCWVNMGDSYCSTPPGNTTKGVSAKSGLHGINGKSGRYRETLDAGHATKVDTSRIPCLKPKDLIGVPWTLAFALRDDGWWLRSDIIWAKGCSGKYLGGSSMPESVTDRCSKSHEYLFMLTKSPCYFFDAEAIAERAVYADQPRGGSTNRYAQNNAGMDNKVYNTRNRRSVWVVNPTPYKEAHFATFPPKLITPCILAGTSEKGCCPECGAPWKRKIEKVVTKVRKAETGLLAEAARAGKVIRNHAAQCGTNSLRDGFREGCNKTVGWEPSCECGISSTVPCVVLDPFNGVATTAVTAWKHNRHAIGIDLNLAYIKQSIRRLESMFAKYPPLLMELRNQ